VQGREGARVDKEKKGGKGREGARGRKKKREGGDGKGEEKKGSGKGILAIPILVCFRRRWLCSHMETLSVSTNCSHTVTAFISYRATDTVQNVQHAVTFTDRVHLIRLKF